MLKLLLRSARGAAGIEYGMALALVAVAAIFAVTQTGDEVEDIFISATSSIEAVAGEQVGGEVQIPAQQGSENRFTMVFGDISGVSRSAATMSAAVAVDGDGDGLSASISGDPSCEFVVDDVASGSSVTLTEGNLVQARVTSSDEFASAVNCYVSVDGGTETWTVTTKQDDEPDAFAFFDAEGAAPGDTVVSDPVPVGGFDVPLSLIVFGDGLPRVSVDESAFAEAPATVTSGQEIRLRANAPAGYLESGTVFYDLNGTGGEWTITTGEAPFQNAVVFESNGTWVVPDGVTTIRLKLWGAGGGGERRQADDWGGGGGFVQSDIAVTPGESLVVTVGTGGSWNRTGGLPGGGTGGAGQESNSPNGAGGGGRSEVLSGSIRLAIAGGGGGSWTGGYGGAGGGSVGQDGYYYDETGVSSGLGGTQTAGGAGGSSSRPGTAGTALNGGAGGGSGASFGGGGGGAGYFGGGGGAGYLSGGGGGGGGGSSYATGANIILTAGSDDVPGNIGDEDYIAGKATGGHDGNGSPGLIVIRY